MLQLVCVSGSFDAPRFFGMDCFTPCDCGLDATTIDNHPMYSEYTSNQSVTSNVYPAYIRSILKGGIAPPTLHTSPTTNHVRFPQ